MYITKNNNILSFWMKGFKSHEHQTASNYWSHASFIALLKAFLRLKRWVSALAIFTWLSSSWHRLKELKTGKLMTFDRRGQNTKIMAFQRTLILCLAMSGPVSVSSRERTCCSNITSGLFPVVQFWYSDMSISPVSLF